LGLEFHEKKLDLSQSSYGIVLCLTLQLVMMLGITTLCQVGHVPNSLIYLKEVYKIAKEDDCFK
jgi:hypothetical protein